MSDQESETNDLAQTNITVHKERKERQSNCKMALTVRLHIDTSPIQPPSYCHSYKQIVRATDITQIQIQIQIQRQTDRQRQGEETHACTHSHTH